MGQGNFEDKTRLMDDSEDRNSYKINKSEARPTNAASQIMSDDEIDGDIVIKDFKGGMSPYSARKHYLARTFGPMQ